MSIDASHIRAARALLGWSARELARRTGLGISTVQRLENGHVTSRPANVETMRQALEAAGVEFIAENGSGPGVRLRKTPV